MNTMRKFGLFRGFVWAIALFALVFSTVLPGVVKSVMAQASYDEVVLFSNSNLTLKAIPFQYSAAEGKWNYKISWSRKRGLLGSIYINGNRFVDSATGSGENYTGFSLVPGDSYNVVFYSLRNGKGVKVANRKFTVTEPEDTYNYPNTYVNPVDNYVTFQSTTLPNAQRNVSYASDMYFTSNSPISDGNVSVSGLPSGLYASNAINQAPVAMPYGSNYSQPQYRYGVSIRGSSTITGTFYPLLTVWANGKSYQQRFTLVVNDGSGYGYGNGGIRFTGNDTFEAYVGTYFDTTISFVYTSNGYTNYSLNTNFDKLPNGLGIDGVNGNQSRNGIICTSGQTCSVRVAGYPTSNGRVQTTLYISDQNGVSASRTIVFNIGGNTGYNGNLNVFPSTLPSGNVNSNYSAQVRVNGFIGNLTNAYWNGLPSGINYRQIYNTNNYNQYNNYTSEVTFELSGYPTVSGNFTPTLVIEINGFRYTQQVSLYISSNGGGNSYGSLQASLLETGNISASPNSRILALPFRLTSDGVYRQVKSFEFEVRRTDGSTYLGQNNPTFDLYWVPSNQLANMSTVFQNGVVTTGFNNEIFLSNYGSTDFQFYVSFDNYVTRGEYRIALKRVLDQYGNEIPFSSLGNVTRIVNVY